MIRVLKNKTLGFRHIHKPIRGFQETRQYLHHPENNYFYAETKQHQIEQQRIFKIKQCGENLFLLSKG